MTQQRYEMVEPLQIEGHTVEYQNILHRARDEINYEHLHEDKKNEWEEWLNDVSARGGFNENANSLNGDGWEIDHGWSRNSYRHFDEDDLDTHFNETKTTQLSQPPVDLEEERAAKRGLDRILKGEERDDVFSTGMPPHD